jgi:hypothetical protein
MPNHICQKTEIKSRWTVPLRRPEVECQDEECPPAAVPEGDGSDEAVAALPAPQPPVVSGNMVKLEPCGLFLLPTVLTVSRDLLGLLELPALLPGYFAFVTL